MIQALFKELSATRDLPAFAFDDDGVAILPLEQGVLHIQCREESGDIVLTATLGVVDENVRGYVFTRLLAANYAANETSGGMLALSEKLDMVVYQYLLKTKDLTVEALGTTLENFLTMAEAWRLHLQRLIEEGAAALADAEAQDDEDDYVYVGEDPEQPSEDKASPLISV